MIIDVLLRQRCEIMPWAGMEQGRDVYGETESRACRLQEGRKLESEGGVDGTADTARAAALMFCTGEPIPARSRVRCGDKEYTVTACAVAHGLGQEHLEVTLV